MIVYSPVDILFNFHGNIKFLKTEFLNDKSRKTTEAVGL